VVAIQPYTVTATLTGGTEIRDYPAHTLISVDVRGDFDSVGTLGFGPLVSYISGNNVSNQSLAMTSPVLQASTSQASASLAHTISFVLPEGESPDSAPTPVDSRVRVQEVAQRRVAALRFSGSWSETRAQAKAQDLIEQVTTAGYRAVGDIFYARYDPPWKPGIFRRNEALVEVS